MIEAWKIGIKISAMDGASSVLRAISGAASLAGQDITKLEGRIKSMQGQLLKGGLMVGAGVGLLASFKLPLDAVRQYDLAFSKFKTLNLGDSVNQQADKFARSAKLVGVSSKELMTTLSESVGLFGNFDVAKQLAPKIAQLNVANSAIFGGKMGQIDEGATRGLMKFIDRRGGTHDPASFMRNLDLAQRMVTGSGGFIKFGDLDQFSKQGGVAFRGLSDQGILDSALLLQEQGGARAGTAMMSIYQNLIAGRTTKKTMGFIQDLGLAKLNMETHGSVGGKPIKSLVMGDIKDAALLQSDAPAWIRNDWLPTLAAHGITSQDAILKATNDLLSNRTGAGQASIMSTQILQLIRDSNLAKNAQGYDATIKTFNNDPNSKFIDLHSKYENLLVALGTSALPIAISALEKLIPVIQTATAWMYKHSTAMKVLVTSIAGLAGVAIVGGTINILAASIRGLGIAAGTVRILAVGKTLESGAVIPGVIGVLGKIPTLLARVPAFLSAFGTAIMWAGRALLMNPIGLTITAIAGAAYLLYRNWSTVAPYLTKVWHVIEAVFHVGMDWISGAVTTVWGAVKPFAILIEHTFLSVFDTVTHAIGGFVNTIAGILSKLWDWLANSKLGKAAGWVGNEVKHGAELIGKVAQSTVVWADRKNSQYDAEHGVTPPAAGLPNILPIIPKINLPTINIPSAKTAPDTQKSRLVHESVARPAAPQVIQVTSVTNVDRKELARTVTTYQVKAATGPQTGMSGFDSSMFPSYIGMNAGY